jgi:uncharacterized protein YjbI with pentapeptide repeats
VSNNNVKVIPALKEALQLSLLNKEVWCGLLRWRLSVIYKLLDLIGIRLLYRKLVPEPEDQPGYRKPSTFVLWCFAVYFAAFGIAAQRFESQLDKVEHKSIILITQLATNLHKKALGRIAHIQTEKCPVKPYFNRPWTVYYSLFTSSVACQSVVKELQAVVEDWKEDLAEVNLSKANLKKADLRDAKLQEADLYDAKLQKADLRDANLQEADLSWAKLQEANLSDANLQEADLSWAKLQKANLSGANLQEADLYDAKLQEANLSGANLQKTNLSKANLQEADLYDAKLQEANLSGAKLQEANLREANLKKTDLRRVNLHNASLFGANLQAADFSSAQLTRVNFGYANLQAAKGLTFQQLQHAKTLYAAQGVPPILATRLKKAKPELFIANFQGDNISHADLQKADLSGANLKKTDLRRANLQEADLSLAKLQEADLSRANLQGAKGLTFEQLLEVKILYGVEGLAPALVARLKQAKPALFESPYEFYETIAP